MTIQVHSTSTRSRHAFVSCTTMLKTLAFSLLLTTFLVASASGQTNWKLVWSDEFNGPYGPPDSTKWAYETVNGSLLNPDDIENNCAPFSNTAPCTATNPNIFLDGNGNLVIQAINTNGTWTSGRMKTAGIAQEQWQYGRIEARMKLPVGDGLWPAFWMLGADLCSVSPVKWPQCGEQDIMEWVQSYTPYKTSSTIHGPGYSGASGISQAMPVPNGGRTDDAGYHIYGVIWSQNQIQFYRDDYTSPVLTQSSLPAGDQWVFNRRFFLILDLAIGGGGFPGTTDSSTPSTAAMLVDYVRVFSADGDGIDSTAWYNVVNHNSNACVDALNYGTTNGTAVQQWACGTQQHNQEWQFRATDSGYFKIVSRSAASQGEVWDVTNLGTTNGTPIQLWQFGGGANQQWQPISLGTGIFEFVDRASGGRCLDVPGASTANGARLEIYDCNGTSAQAWTLIQQP